MAAKRLREPKPTKGSQLLTRLTINQTELASVFGVSQPSIVQWQKGITKPSPPKRRLAEEKYNIPIGSWDEPLEASEVSPSIGSPSEPGPDIPSGAIGKAQMLESFVTGEMARIQKDSIATPKERAAVLKVCAETLHKLAALTGEHDLGSRILETAAWARIKAALGDALSPYPEASAACAAALRRIEAVG